MKVYLTKQKHELGNRYSGTNKHFECEVMFFDKIEDRGIMDGFSLLIRSIPVRTSRSPLKWIYHEVT